MALVFQYGSNTSSHRLNSYDRLRGDARKLGLVCTKEPHQLDFTVWSNSNKCAAADIVPGSGRTIWGVLYKIPDHLIHRETSGERKSLDEIEGEDNNYRRLEIYLRYRNGRPINQKVITYVVKERKPNLETSIDYVSHIINGLKEFNAPKGYIEYVKQRVIKNNPLLRSYIEKNEFSPHKKHNTNSKNPKSFGVRFLY